MEKTGIGRKKATGNSCSKMSSTTATTQRLGDKAPTLANKIFMMRWHALCQPSGLAKYFATLAWDFSNTI